MVGQAASRRSEARARVRPVRRWCPRRCAGRACPCAARSC